MDAPWGRRDYSLLSEDDRREMLRVYEANSEVAEALSRAARGFEEGFRDASGGGDAT